MSFEKWTEGELDARTSALVDDLIHFGKQHIRDAYNEIDALTAKLHAAEEREASMRKALEDVRDHNFPMGALPEDGLSNVSTFADKALSAAPEGRVEKLEAVVEAAKGEHGCTYDKSSCPICQAPFQSRRGGVA